MRIAKIFAHFAAVIKILSFESWTGRHFLISSNQIKCIVKD